VVKRVFPIARRQPFLRVQYQHAGQAGQGATAFCGTSSPPPAVRRLVLVIAQISTPATAYSRRRVRPRDNIGVKDPNVMIVDNDAGRNSSLPIAIKNDTML